MYESKLKSADTDQLFDAILSLQTREECYRFFEDLCTINEIRSLSQRMEVASLLHEGYTYTAIEEKTGASTATISRVNRSYMYGAKGYRLVLKKQEE